MHDIMLIQAQLRIREEELHAERARARRGGPRRTSRQDVAERMRRHHDDLDG